MRAARVLSAGAISLLALSSGCGGGERTFTAEEFVEEANRNGTSLELGRPLPAVGEDQIYAVRLDEPGPERGMGPATGETEEQGGGSLRLTGSAASAEEGHARCERAASLICFRAANVVLIFEPGVEPAELTRLADAIRAMESR